MAALLDERAAGVAAEAVPVADLVQEREAVLADRHHAHVADGAAAHLGEQPLRRRHVAVLEPHPHDCGRAARRRPGRRRRGSRRRSCTAASRPARAARCRGRRRGSSRWVWFGEAMTTASHSPDVDQLDGGRRTGRAGRRCRRRCCAQSSERSVGVGDRRDADAVDGEQVADVLDAHHPRADDAVPDLVARHDRAAYVVTVCVGSSVTDRLYFRQLLSGRDFAVGDPVATQMVNFVYAVGDRADGRVPARRSGLRRRRHRRRRRGRRHGRRRRARHALPPRPRRRLDDGH